MARCCSKSDAVVVPVAFSGGIDAFEKERRDTPRYRQNIVIGTPLDLTDMNIKEQKSHIHQAIVDLYLPCLGSSCEETRLEHIIL